MMPAELTVLSTSDRSFYALVGELDRFIASWGTSPADPLQRATDVAGVAVPHSPIAIESNRRQLEDDKQRLQLEIDVAKLNAQLTHAKADEQAAALAARKHEVARRREELALEVEEKSLGDRVRAAQRGWAAQHPQLQKTLAPLETEEREMAEKFARLRLCIRHESELLDMLDSDERLTAERIGARAARERWNRIRQTVKIAPREEIPDDDTFFEAPLPPAAPPEAPDAGR